MHLVRLDYSSVVLPNGNVMVLGGAYSDPNLDQTETTEMELYNRVANTLTAKASVPGSNWYTDQSAEVLPDGTVLTSDGRNQSAYIYNPTTNRWSNGPQRLFGDTSSDENWVKLPGGQILAVPSSGSRLLTPQVFVPGRTPARDVWVPTANLSAVLTHAPNGNLPEMGPAVLLPDGRVWQIGGNNLTAIYYDRSYDSQLWLYTPAGTLSAAKYKFNAIDGTLTVKPKVVDGRVDYGIKSISLWVFLSATSWPRNPLPIAGAQHFATQQRGR
jgi:hypothetical protein